MSENDGGSEAIIISRRMVGTKFAPARAVAAALYTQKMRVSPYFSPQSSPDAPAPQRSHPRREDGFVLIAVLFAIAIMAAGAAYFAGRVDGLRAEALTLARWADAERDALTAREVLIHAYLTQRDARPGWPYANSLMRFDGRPYQLTPQLSLRVQDERGLQSLVVFEDAQLPRLLSTFGVPVERHARLIDTLADYTDIDSLRRLNGAEKTEYLAAGVMPPANDMPRHRDELTRILSWRDLVSSVESSLGPDARERFLALFSASRAPGINVNTAPAPILATLQGIDPARVSALIDHRRSHLFQSHAELLPFASGAFNVERALFVPAWTWRVSVESSELPFLLECRVHISPLSRDRPATVSECQRRSPASVDSRWDAQLISVAAGRTLGSTQRSAEPRALPLVALNQPPRLPTATNANEPRPTQNAEPLEWLSRHLVSVPSTTGRPAWQ